MRMLSNFGSPHPVCVISALVIACLLCPLTASSAAPPAENLVTNSSFEENHGPGGPATDWNVPRVPEGGVNQTSTAKVHSGRHCHEIRVPDNTAVDWYQTNQEVVGAIAGRTYTLSVFIQADNVRDGAGAYCSINCFDAAGKRIDIADAAAKVLGTVTEWRRQSVTTTIPKGTTRVVVILTLHGHGTAYFDDAQLEEGTAATDYHVSSADRLAAERAERQRAAAEKFFQASPLRAGTVGTVAILRDNLPADGCASSPERLGRWLKDAGYQVAYLNAEQLTNSFILRGPAATREASPTSGDADHPTFDLLVLPYGGSFPAAAAPALKAFLRQHGACFCTGGYAFDALLVNHDGKWWRPNELPLPDTALTTVLDFDSGAGSGWNPGSDASGTPPVLTAVPGRPGHGQALQFTANPMHVWATASIEVGNKLPADWAITRFWAKGDANTPKLAIEWDERDGSRWKATVPLTTEWKEYVLKVSDFSYWQDNPSVGRGGSGDHLRPATTDRLLFGIALDIVAPDQPHTFWIDDIAVQPDPLADLRLEPNGLNTRYARIRDAMWPTPDQIPLFDPSHSLEWVRTARPSAGQFAVTGDAVWQGPFTGYAAVGMTSNQGHGFGPNLSRLVPLLDGLDRYGRFRGSIGSIMQTYDGYYSGASFVFFGVTNRDLFGPDSPQGRSLFLDTVRHLLQRVYLHDTDTEFSAYRPGETAQLRTRISNFSRAAVKVEARMEVSAMSGAAAASPPLFSGSRALTLASGTTEPVNLEWKVPADGAELYRVRAKLLIGGKQIDQEDNGVVVWRAPTGEPASPVTTQGPYFAWGGRPLLALGCQTYWGQNGSVTARSPLAFARDFSMMQDYGLHFSRAFIPFATESDRRESDAIVALSQQHHVLLYDAPNLGNSADPAKLAEAADQAKTIGARYRGVPWMLVDICNEPHIGIHDPDMDAAFNAFLRQKYGTTAHLRQVWGADAPELGQVKLAPLTNRWDDMRSFDTHLFLATVQQLWADSNRTALRSTDSSRLCSVGFTQGYGGADRICDPPIGSRNLDFTDRHYYGPFDGFAAQLKDIDSRVLGKPMVQGECGAKSHPTYTEKDPWGMGDTPEKFCQRFLYLVHHAFGLGATALSSWHWRDPMEGIFPCGLTHADGVPRPAASVMRALAFAFGQLRPRYETPQVLLVVPENHRLGGSRTAVTNAIHRCEELLISCQVDFGLISEKQLDADSEVRQIPTGVRELFYPVPYCPSDETVQQLKAFVAGGGTLYFSGDISYDPERKLTRTARLVELAGVTRTGECYPNIARAGQPQVKLQSAVPGIAGGDARPAIDIHPTGATVLASAPDGKPVITSYRNGRGAVVFCADPLETALNPLPWHRALYLKLLAEAKVTRDPVQPDLATLRCFRIPLQPGGQAYVLYNDSDAPVTATLQASPSRRVSLDIAANRPALTVVDGKGNLTAVEAEGKVNTPQPLLTVTGHAIVLSLDGRDLSSSRRFLILPMPGGPGGIDLPSLSAMRIELGELHDTKWSRLETLHADAQGRLRYDAEQALNMIIAASPDEFAAAVKQVEDFTQFPK